MMWGCSDDVDSDLSLIGNGNDSDGNISLDKMSELPNQNSQIESQSSRTQVERLLDPLPILMRHRTLFEDEDSDDDYFIKTDDIYDNGSDTFLSFVQSSPSSQDTGHFEDLANLPHEIVERSRQPPPRPIKRLVGSSWVREHLGNMLEGVVLSIKNNIPVSLQLRSRQTSSWNTMAFSPGAQGHRFRSPTLCLGWGS